MTELCPALAQSASMLSLVACLPQETLEPVGLEARRGTCVLGLPAGDLLVKFGVGQRPQLRRDGAFVAGQMIHAEYHTASGAPWA